MRTHLFEGYFYQISENYKIDFDNTLKIFSEMDLGNLEVGMNELCDYSKDLIASKYSDLSLECNKVC